MRTFFVSLTPRPLAIAALSALVLTACGSGGESATDAVASQQTIEVHETDFAIEPAPGRVEKAGVVRISVKNDGEKPHSLAVETPNGVVQTETLAAGESGHATATLAEGTYTWFCPVGDHRERGMEGKLVVGGTGGEATPDETEYRGKAGTY